MNRIVILGTLWLQFFSLGLFLGRKLVVFPLPPKMAHNEDEDDSDANILEVAGLAHCHQNAAEAPKNALTNSHHHFVVVVVMVVC